ncbi:MAG: hypothetical protein PHP35_00490 [Candidatus Colwellbacteria bacterium]|nr:hypothetical protein [Candidatus Colwellbacteria bacterium]
MSIKSSLKVVGFLILSVIFIGAFIFLIFYKSKKSVEEQLYNSISPSNVSAYECDLKVKEIQEKEMSILIEMSPKDMLTKTRLRDFAYDTNLKRCFGLRSGTNSSGNQFDEVEDIFSEMPLWACEMLESGKIYCAIKDFKEGGFNFVNYPETPGFPPAWSEFKNNLAR